MVVEYKGFRERWQSSAAAAGAPVSHADVSEHSPSSCQQSINDWEPVGDVDSFNLFPLQVDDCDDAAATEGGSAPEDVDRRVPIFMRPTPKSVASPSNSLSSVSMSIKRTADEMASKQVHKVIADIKQPWQMGPLASLFSKQKPFWERLQRQNKMTMVGISDHIVASSTSSSIPKPVKQTELTVQRIRASRLVASQDDFRHLALSRFKTMVLLDLDSTRLGQSLRSFAGTLCPDDELSQIFMDVFAPKATGTVLKRCNSLWRFSCWLQSQCAGSPFSQNEMMLYKYICHLRDVGAGSTTPSQLVEALRFADNLLGFTQVRLQDVLSPRVTGAAHSIFMTKRIRKPAETLTVSEVSELEHICVNDAESHRRVVAGHLLFSFAAAARWHDSMYVVALETSMAGDISLLEALTSKHKSSRGKEQQMELLPFTALGRITTDDFWGRSWVEARQECQAESWNHFLNSWSESAHCWVDSRMSTAEATGWLRELLEPHVGPERAVKLTVHGLKATLLSWAAKSTIFTADEQLTLGHHVHSLYRSSMIYSRDNQIKLCHKLNQMFAKIRNGQFDPDATRVNRLFQLAYNAILENESTEDSSESSSDSDASSVASSDGEHDSVSQKPHFKRLDADNMEADLCLINTNSQVIHLLISEDEKFWCGRHPSASFRKASREDLNATEAVICANCSHSYRAAGHGHG